MYCQFEDSIFCKNFKINLKFNHQEQTKYLIQIQKLYLF